jgi:hypothetical protein
VKTYGLVLLGALVAAAGQVSAQEQPPVPPPASTPPPATPQTPPQTPPVQTPPPQTPPAQTLPPQTPPPQTPPPPTAPVAAPAATPGAPAAVDPRRRREQIRLMEGLLTNAVRNGAEETAKVIRSRQPGLMLFTGDARARGVFLEGYGIFFHVEIPGVRPSVASLVEMFEAQRSEAQRNAQPRAMGTPPMAPTFDPNASYTEAVQRQLIDAMLDFRIDLRPDEWLTIAARDADGPLAPGEIYESITIILQVKGSDLADFAAGRLTRADARARVQVKEF